MELELIEKLVLNTDEHKIIKSRYRKNLIQLRLKTQKGLNKVSKLVKPISFDQMFVFPELIDDCIDVLKKVDPAILNQNGNYIGKYKSSFCVWVERLQRRDLINYYSDRTIYADLISQKFSPFNISESMFGKSHFRADKLYQLQFDTLLSQVYQKAKQRK